jgi:hypothetical protein
LTDEELAWRGVGGGEKFAEVVAGDFFNGLEEEACN